MRSGAPRASTPVLFPRSSASIARAALRAAYELHGDSLIRESGFACKAELLIKLDRMRVRIAEVPVALDWSRREGESKMRVLPTVGGYARMMMRQASAKERA